MMKKKEVLGIAAASAMSLMLCGCFSVKVASSPILGEDVKSHVTVDNYGWYLFGCVPLACGNEKLDSWCAFSLFCDEVRPEIAYGKLKDVATRENCEIRDFRMVNGNDVLFDFFGYNIPWIVVTKEVKISANLAKKGVVK